MIRLYENNAGLEHCNVDEFQMKNPEQLTSVSKDRICCNIWSGTFPNTFSGALDGGFLKLGVPFWGSP